MRKEIMIQASVGKQLTEPHWIDVQNLARTELSSEDGAHPIESALGTDTGPGWLAALAGPQTIRFLFDKAIQVRKVHLEFRESQTPRIQEFLLRWSSDHGQSYREIVRQQYNFNPPGTTSEVEDYEVDLPGLTTLELTITPNIGRSDVRASLARLQLA
jgi:hypothetical protein